MWEWLVLGVVYMGTICALCVVTIPKWSAPDHISPPISPRPISPLSQSRRQVFTPAPLRNSPPPPSSPEKSEDFPDWDDITDDDVTVAANMV